MILRRIWSGSDAFFIRDMRAEDADAIAGLHAQCFSVAWSQDDFHTLLLQDTVFGFIACRTGRKAPQMAEGFVLARMAAGEAEILSIGVAPSSRRAGLGRQLMDAVLRRLHAERTEALFLEVEEQNRPALALYRRLGFIQVGQRPGYYHQFGGTGAIVMRRDLR